MNGCSYETCNPWGSGWGLLLENSLTHSSPLWKVSLKRSYFFISLQSPNFWCLESQEPSLEKRRLKLALQFALKLKTNTSNPAHEYAFNCVNEELYDARPKSIRSFGLRVKPYLEDPDIDLDLLSQNHFTPIPPWQIRKPNKPFTIGAKKV